MKKNKMMRIASVLLVAVLLSTCAISGTFAKYVTEVSNQDAARVARWGFNGTNEQIAITDLFKATYDNNNVNGKDGANVIAPGTTNKVAFIFTYTEGNGATAPEVAYTLKVDVSESTINDAIKNNPNIKWAVVKTTELESGEVPADKWTDWDGMIAKLNALDGDESFVPGEALPDICTEHTIAWKWDIGANNDANDTQNKMDTAMGNTADLNVKIVIKVTATQVD